MRFAHKLFFSVATAVIHNALALRKVQLNPPDVEDFVSLLQMPKMPRSPSHKGGPGRAGKDLHHCVDMYANGLDSIRPGTRLGNHIRTWPMTVPATSTRQIVFGAMMGGTASVSYAYALSQIMGLRTYHHPGVLTNKTLTMNDAVCTWANSHDHDFFRLWDSDFATSCRPNLQEVDVTTLPEIDAFLEQPVDLYFPLFFLSFPNARWILSTRDSHDWVTDYNREFNSSTNVIPIQLPCLRYDGNSSSMVMGSFSTDENARMYELLNEFIRCAVAPDKLFHYDLFADGTAGLSNKLGKWLGIPTPPSTDAPFPFRSVSGFMRDAVKSDSMKHLGHSGVQDGA